MPRQPDALEERILRALDSNAPLVVVYDASGTASENTLDWAAACDEVWLVVEGDASGAELFPTNSCALHADAVLASSSTKAGTEAALRQCCHDRGLQGVLPKDGGVRVAAG